MSRPGSPSDAASSPVAATDAAASNPADPEGEANRSTGPLVRLARSTGPAGRKEREDATPEGPAARGTGSPDTASSRNARSAAGGTTVEPSVTVTAGGCTDMGPVRVANEDCLLISDLGGECMWSVPSPAPGARAETGADRERSLAAASPAFERMIRPLFVVCDGMGGAAGGGVASQLAAGIIRDELRESQATVNREIFARLLRRAVRVANRRIWEESRRALRLRGMGTTATAAGLVGSSLVIAQVGDSRAYVARDGVLVQVTRDQSVASALVRSGHLDPDEAQQTPHANVILQALGVHKDVEVALSVASLRRGDRLLLCTDGLYGPLGDEAIAQILTLGRGPADASRLLVEAACTAGTQDNVSALVVDFAGDGLDARSVGDELRFVEFDPMEEGERALRTTSRVVQRLAARAGIGDDPGPPVVPATGQHSIVRAMKKHRANPAHDRDMTGPAGAALRRSSRLPWTIWLVAVAALGAIAVWLLSAFVL